MLIYFRGETDMKIKYIAPLVLASGLVLGGCANDNNSNNDSGNKSSEKDNKGNNNQSSSNSKQNTQSDIKFDYPKDGVKGIYVSAYSTKGEKFDELSKFIENTDLNTMVIDVKDDSGNVTINFNTGNKLIDKNSIDIVDAKPLLKKMKEHNIYPIARIVTFKDSKLAEEHPDWSFKQKNGELWESAGGDKFINPFMKEVWNYDIDVAKAAAKAGFQEIQFDYVRFPEGFENISSSLDYNKGQYKNSKLSEMDQRMDTISKFLGTAKKELKDYDVDVSADVFGYAATAEKTPGIGQNFNDISKNVDVISSMIYPSHWNNGDFGIEHPDLKPYDTIDKYLDKEDYMLDRLGNNKPKARPWLQDFTASYLGAGNYKEYDAKAVEDQIQALADHNIHEFLLWDAAGDYTRGVNYSPKPNKEKVEENKKELQEYKEQVKKSEEKGKKQDNKSNDDNNSNNDSQDNSNNNNSSQNN